MSSMHVCVEFVCIGVGNHLHTYIRLLMPSGVFSGDGCIALQP